MPGWRQHADEGRSRSPARRLGQYGPELFSWLRSYCWGSIAAAQIVRNADAKVQGDSRRNLRPDRCIQRLANSIRNLGNAERLVNSLMPQSLFPQRLAVPDSLIEIVMPPYDIFHWLRELNPAKFHLFWCKARWSRRVVARFKKSTSCRRVILDFASLAQRSQSF